MKDQRYSAIKSLIANNQFNKFSEIFTIAPISVVCKDLKLNYSTFHRKVHKPALFTLKDLHSMAKLFDCDVLELVKLAVKSMPEMGRIR